MRAITLAALVLALTASTAAAASCVLSPNGAYMTAGTCTTYNSCGASFCTCVGVTTVTNPNMCLSAAPNATTCSQIQTCLGGYLRCIGNVPSTATGCTSLNMTLALAQRTAAASGYVNSTLQRSCRNRVCSIMNATTTTCDFGVNDSAVCSYRAPPAVLPEGTVVAMEFSLVLSGTAWALVVNDPDKLAALKVALAADIAKLLGVLPEHIIIRDIYVASLHVDAIVDAKAGVAPDVLNTRLQSGASNTSWLAGVKSSYAAVSTETISVTSLAATSTAAPGVVTPAPPPANTTQTPTSTVATSGPAATPIAGSSSASVLVTLAFAAAAAAVALF